MNTELFGNPDNNPWMQLNPDYRKSAPTNGFYCCRCQKSVRLTGARAVEVNYDTLEVRNNPLGKELIGIDCWKQVIKENNP